MKLQLKKPRDLLLGIFIGLVLGLCIAIVVALVVTKTASKVTSKHDYPGKIVKQAESEPLPDPNKPMHAKASSGAVASGKRATTKVASKAAKPEKAEEEKVKRKEWRYYLQAGAYLNEDEAENVRAQLAFMGLEAYISERWSARGTLHRVRTGPLASVEQMNQERRKLIQQGFQPSVIRLQIKEKNKKH